MPEFEVTNNGDSPVLLISATLKTAVSEYTGRPTQFEGKWKTVLPKASTRMSLVFEFGTSMYKVLQDPVELKLRFRIGDREAEFSIPMVKTFGK